MINLLYGISKLLCIIDQRELEIALYVYRCLFNTDMFQACFSNGCCALLFGWQDYSCISSRWITPTISSTPLPCLEDSYGLQVPISFNNPPGNKNATIHQVTTILATSKNVLFPGRYHLLTTITDDPTLIIAWMPMRVIIKVSGHQYWWLVDG